MSTNIRIGRVTGIEVRFHFTLLLYLAFLPLLRGQEPVYALLLGFTALLSLLVHELAHAAAAQSLRIRTLSVMVYFLGGVARLERRPQPHEELRIYLAGPLASLSLAALFAGLSAAFGPHRLIEDLLWVNLGIGAIHLIPAFPLDGGRILRALLSLRWPELKATLWASYAGRAAAALLAVYGLYQLAWLPALSAVFFFLASRKEYEDLRGILLMQGAIVREVMMERFESLDHGSTLREAAEKLLTSAQQDFPVLHGSQVVGLLSREQLMDAISTDGPEAYVAGAMDRDFLALAPDSSLPAIVGRLAENDYRALVFQHGRLLGMVTLDKLNEFLVLRSLGLRRSVA